MSKIKDNGKNSFVFYDSFLSAMKHLNDAEFRECVLRIRDYALEGIDEESQSPYVNIILAMAKPNLDSARRRYELAVENGKKGAEFGKLGGAPKGNQNARKNNPQSTPKQPLDVDANEDVDVNEDENGDIDVYDVADGTSGKQGFSSSFSNSSNSVLINEANDSERLKENKDKEPLQEVYNFKGFELSTASEPEKEIHINSKSESNNTPPVSPCSEKEAWCSAARPRRREVKGGVYDQGEYYQLCFNNYMLDLVDMRLGKLPQDDNLFWQAVNLYSDLYGVSDKKQAAKTVTHMVADIIKASQ